MQFLNTLCLNLVLYKIGWLIWLYVAHVGKNMIKFVNIHKILRILMGAI
jgi:hypothetical protein